MPITQDRLIALIHIVDQALSTKEKMLNMIDTELDAALSDYYERDRSRENTLASDLLARIQTIKSLAEEPLISHTAIETLAREREHFRSARRANIRAAKSMQKKRNKSDSLYVEWPEKGSISNE